MLGSCGSGRGAEDWAVAVVGADPMFGGGAFLAPRLGEDPFLGLAGDSSLRAQFLREQSAVHDAMALALVRECATEDDSVEALVFLRSEAGAAMADAEVTALARWRHADDAFPAEAARTFGSPTLVGAGARKQLEEVAREMVTGGSPSPPRLAICVAATRLEPAQAESISRWFASPAGSRWLEIRTRAFSLANERYVAFLLTAKERGFTQNRMDLPDLVLPRATFEDAPPKGR